MYNVWSSVLYSFQVYYKTAFLALKATQWIMSAFQNKRVNISFFFGNFFFSFLFFALQSLPVVWKASDISERNKRTFQNSPEWPSHHDLPLKKKSNKYRHLNELKQQKYFWKYTHKHTSDQRSWAVLNPAWANSARVWQAMDSSAFVKKKNKKETEKQK